MRVGCITQFDITATGVKSHFNISRMPFRDNSGRLISTLQEWNHARNQQRNWETVNQVISLRTLPEDITFPVKENNGWSFEFTVENPSTVEMYGDPVGALISDCQDVPMLIGLGENKDIGVYLVPGHNIHFEIVADK